MLLDGAALVLAITSSSLPAPGQRYILEVMLHALLNQQQAMDIMQQQAVLDSPARQSVHLAAWGSNDASG